MNLFWEMHSEIPREGPGDEASTLRALHLMSDLPAAPRLLDVGCGPGAQTLHLAGATRGQITAVDMHQPFLDRLAARAQAEGLAERITVRRMSMDALDFPDESFDVIWSEGAIYIMGFEAGLRNWQRLLKPGGYIAVTEVSWLKPAPPAEVAEFWQAGYPAMQTTQANLEIIRRAGYRVVGHFDLPALSWENYYLPLEARVHGLKQKYAADPAAQQMLDAELVEIDIYRRFLGWFSYVFYVMQKI